jgi:hypothetical protein
MSFRLIEILEREVGYVFARILHGSEELILKVWDKDGSLGSRPKDKDILGELNYEEVHSCRSVSCFSDDDSTIIGFDGLFLVRGRVCQVIETDDDCVYDIYLQQGADFLAVLKSDLKGMQLRTKDGVEVVVSGLSLFPSRK